MENKICEVNSKACVVERKSIGGMVKKG